MTCRLCNGASIVHVNGKTADLVTISSLNEFHNGRIPEKFNVGEGDYLSFSYCSSCGAIQGGEWPIQLEDETKCPECGSSNLDEESIFQHCLECGCLLENKS